MSDQITRMRILREVALHVDGFYTKAEDLGRKAATKDALEDKKRSQIKGLESLANSAFKTTDIFNFIKLRIARHKEWRTGRWGEELLTYLSSDLYACRETICKKLEIAVESAEGLEVHLLLIREFIKQLAAHYEFSCSSLYSGDDR